MSGPPAPIKERVRAALHILRGHPCIIGVTFEKCYLAEGVDHRRRMSNDQPDHVLELLLEAADALSYPEHLPEDLDLAARLRAYAALDPHPIEAAYIQGVNYAVDSIMSALRAMKLTDEPDAPEGPSRR